MICDNQTNYLYLADALPKTYPAFWRRFEKLLQQTGIHYSLLPDTRDVWAVDYMPVQLNANEFVRFVYDPAYLKSKKYRNTISNADEICAQIGIETRKTDIILDGGNLTRWNNKVIMTDRIFRDNPKYDRKELISKLYKLLNVDHIFLIPEQPGDFTGHSDGMVRFIDEDTVLVNDYREENHWFRRGFEIALHNAGLDMIKIPYCVYDNKSYQQANGEYINFLEMEGKIIIPIFGMKEDEQAVRTLESVFSGQHIETMESNEIAQDGGVLNCISWNIRVDD